MIPTKTIELLETNERAIAEARAAQSSGATRIALTGDVAGILIDGEPAGPGERTLTGRTHFRLGDVELVVIPPAGAASAEEALSSALKKQQSALADLALADLAAARARNDTARDAASELRTIAARIEATTPADENVGLAAGAGALKLFIVELADETEADEGFPDIAALTAALEAADIALARTEGLKTARLPRSGVPRRRMRRSLPPKRETRVISLMLPVKSQRSRAGRNFLAWWMISLVPASRQRKRP